MADALVEAVIRAQKFSDECERLLSSPPEDKPDDRNAALEEAAVAAENYGNGIYGDPHSEQIAKFTAQRIAEGIRGMKTAALEG